MMSIKSVWLSAWLLCATLDALYATGLTLVRGGDVGQVWRGVAAGPFGDAAQMWGPSGILTGILVHFALMAVMVTIGLWLERHTPLGDVAAWKAGTLYGLVLYFVMYGLVLPLRLGVPFPNPDKAKLALGLFPHIFLVGIPMFYLFRRTLPPS